ncbi:MAG: glycosyltransferase [Pseudomonadota bacterium]
MRVLIVVTHLLGTGHLARALVLGRAFADAGWQVRVASGGRAVPHLDATGVDLVQLPAVHVEGTDFGTLHGPDGPASARYMQARQHALLACLDPRPDLLVTELFPFGRRSLRAEFGALLDAAAGIPALASIRDILAPPSKPARATWTEEVIARHYTGVLVHSDPSLIPLAASWPVTPALADVLHYTGFVAPPMPVAVDASAGEVLVTAGGGAVGHKMFTVAAEAAAADPHRTWRCLTRAEITGPPNMLVEPPRPDFRNLLPKAAALVGMCGYNTAMDVLQTGVPALFVPFDDGGEVEQSLRAGALSDQPGIAVMRSAQLTGPTLLAALTRVSAAPARPARTAGMDGAAQTVRIARKLIRAH